MPTKLKLTRFGIRFATRFTPAKLMKWASNVALATHLNESNAIEISRQIWGNVHNHRAQGTGENDWHTPEKYLDLAQ